MGIVYLLFSTPMNIVSLKEKKGASILPPFTHPYLVKEFAKKKVVSAASTWHCFFAVLALLL